MEFSTPRPVQRQAASKSEPASHPQHQSQRIVPNNEKPEKSKKRRVWPAIVGVIVLLLVVGGGWFLFTKMKGSVSTIDSSKYQAVFFTNDQVYFGKLTQLNGDYMKLTDIYYLQTQSSGEDTDSKNPQQSGASQNDVQLIKLGSEIHGPEDEMIISKSQVLFYENLKTDSKVTQLIEQHKQ